MAPRKLKDKRGSMAVDIKEETINEAASVILGEDLGQKKKRGRPRKASSAYAEKDGDENGRGEGGEEDEEEEEEGEASNEEEGGKVKQEEEEEEEEEDEEEKGSTITKEGVTQNSSHEQKREKLKKKTRRLGLRETTQNGKDVLDLQSSHALALPSLKQAKSLSRRSRTRKGKPRRAAEASF